MIASLTLAVVLYSLLAALLLTVVALRGERSPVAAMPLVSLQIGFVLLAILDIVANRAQLSMVHLSYLGVGLIVLPVAGSMARNDRGSWASMTLAIACLMVAVVTVRVAQTVHGYA